MATAVSGGELRDSTATVSSSQGICCLAARAGVGRQKNVCLRVCRTHAAVGATELLQSVYNGSGVCVVRPVTRGSSARTPSLRPRGFWQVFSSQRQKSGMSLAKRGARGFALAAE